MSVQSSPILSSIIDPAPQRRQQSEPEEARAGEAFALPEPARETQVRRDSEAKADPRTRSDEVAQEPPKPVRADARTRAADADADDGTKSPANSQTKPPGDAPAAQPIKLDAGALVTIAAAAQVETPNGAGGVAPDESDPAIGEPPSSVVTLPEFQLLASPEMLPVEAPATPPASVIASAADAAPELVAPPLAAAALLASNADAGAGETVDVSPAKSGGIAALAQLALAGAARENAKGLPVADNAAETEIRLPQGSTGSETAASAQTSFSDIMSKQAGAEDGAGLAVQTQPEFKVADFGRTDQAPIDLSFLSQARPGKPDGGIALPPAETGPATAGAHTAGGGSATPVHVVPIEIGLRALAGARSFDIRLDPAELGRVDVNLDISDTGEVTAKLVVDRVETLHLLQRDARTLERAFEQAGLKPTDGGVEITLRDPSDQSGFRQNRQQDDAQRRGGARQEQGEDGVEPTQSASARRLVRLGGVDLSI